MLNYEFGRLPVAGWSCGALSGFKDKRPGSTDQKAILQIGIGIEIGSGTSVDDPAVIYDKRAVRYVER